LLVQQTLATYEAIGSFNDPRYQAARRVFDLCHVCRLDPWPEFLRRAASEERMNVQVNWRIYKELNDRGWDITARLGELGVPTLITSGRYDVTTPVQVELVHRGIRESEWILFEESSHYPHAEEPEHYLAVLDTFLTRVEHRVAGDT
jgi:pimeloyl-ACP methyl ester carboxylesterase